MDKMVEGKMMEQNPLAFSQQEGDEPALTCQK